MADTAGVERIAREVFMAVFAGDARGIGWAMRRIAAIMQDVSISAGDVVYREGDPGDSLYFVVSGGIKLVREGARDWFFEGRSIVGVNDVILERPRARTAIATAPSHLLKVRGADWLDLVEDSFELARRVVTGLASSVHQLRLEPPLGGLEEPHPPDPIRLGPSSNLVERILLLRGVPLFARASIQSLTSLAELAEDVHISGGSVVPTRDPPTRQLVVVASGEAVVALGNGRVAAQFGPGSLIGGAGALAGADFEARAVEPLRAIGVALEDYFDVMEEHFTLTRSALTALAEQRERLLDREG